MATKRELFINSIKLVKVDEKTNIPTVLFYQGGKCHIGYEAIEKNDSPELLSEDFKVELGREDPSTQTRRTFETSAGRSRTAVGLAQDFIHQALGRLESWCNERGTPMPTRILVAEPIAMGNAQGVLDTWLKNYRSSLRRILKGRFQEIDFLPEPFAVFQYYRYGLKHALVAQHLRHIALVLDFGGGTFDVSVIETTGKGDISQSGRNQRPLAASSIPVGGFYINRVIAETLLFENLDKGVSKSEIRKALEKFSELKNAAPDELDTLRSDLRNFVRHFKSCLSSVESAKITICNNIPYWNLSADLSKAVACRVRVPRNPLVSAPEWAEIRLDARRLRELFEQRIWDQKLKPAIKDAIARAERELEGKPISLVLLSGGSSNIRWLTPLIERDLRQDLANAQILDFSENFQEVVSKGLAVECARRFYTEGTGDFRAVTYNRLCLALRADDGRLEVRRYRPITDQTPKESVDEGVLLPSASILKDSVGLPLRWKTSLSSPPRRHLDYFFMRGSFDPDDVSSLHNVDHRAHTPPGTKFASGIEIEITINEDGTAHPKFTYGHGEKGGQVIVSGRPFYLDATFVAELAAGNTYLGFDFGTSNSSLSFVEDNDIRAYEERSRDGAWLELSDLVAVLPYPAAAPLAAYIAETDKKQMDLCGREAFEAMLAFAAYTAYCEMCVRRPKADTFLFKGLQHRSAGPLWHLLQQTLKSLGDRAKFSAAYLLLLRDAYKAEFNDAVTQLAQQKHGKIVTNLNYPRILTMLGNLISASLANRAVGFFEHVTQKKFQSKFSGIFRSAKGPSAPFVEIFEYDGTQSFSSDQVFICDHESGQALSLSPLIIVGLAEATNHYEQEEMYLFDTDRAKDATYAYRSVRPGKEQPITVQGDFSILFNMLHSMKEMDPELNLVEGIRLQTRTDT